MVRVLKAYDQVCWRRGEGKIKKIHGDEIKM